MKAWQYKLLHTIDKGFTVPHSLLGQYITSYGTVPQQGKEK